MQPCSMATAACWASATSLPVAAESRHRRSRILRWSGPGPTMRAVGRSNSDDTKANAVSTVDGGLNIRGLVAIRTNPASTRTDRAKGSGPVARRVSQFAYSGCSGVESSKCAYIRTLTSGSNISGQVGWDPNWTWSSVMSRARGRSRSTPSRSWLPRIVTSRNGGGSDGLRRLRASSSVFATKALTLKPWSAASRRTCLASWSSSEIVVLIMQSITSMHQNINITLFRSWKDWYVLPCKLA